MEFEYSDKNPRSAVAFASFDAMHTRVEVIMASVSREQAHSAAEKIEGLTAKIERELSRHIPQSAIAVLNASKGEDSVTVDNDVYFVLELCETMRRATLGYIDISALSPVRREPAYTTSPDVSLTA